MELQLTELHVGESTVGLESLSGCPEAQQMSGCESTVKQLQDSCASISSLGREQADFQVKNVHFDSLSVLRWPMECKCFTLFVMQNLLIISNS